MHMCACSCRYGDHAAGLWRMLPINDDLTISYLNILDDIERLVSGNNPVMRNFMLAMAWDGTLRRLARTLACGWPLD